MPQTVSTKAGKILKHLMEEQKLTTSELARLASIEQSTLHRLLAGKSASPKLETILPLADYFGITIDQLIGKESLPSNREPGTRKVAEQAFQEVPLLNWKEFSNIESYSSATKYIKTCEAVSKESFALEVQDSSMHPRFPEGTILIFDSEIKPENNDFVLVALSSNDEITFKQLRIDGNDIYLKPLNPDFKPKEVEKKNDLKFFGTLVEARTARTNYKKT